MISDSGLKRAPAAPLASGAARWPAAWPTSFALARARWRWGRRLAGLGRGCLIVFAAVALISANRETGLLTLGAVAQVHSDVRGGVSVGAAYLLLPLGVTLWLAGRWLLWRRRARRLDRGLGPWVVVAPVLLLLGLTIAHLSAVLGWADITFVLVGLGLLVVTYLFVWWDGSSSLALAAFVALVGGVQSLVGVGQFIFQHDLGLRVLGELALNPAVRGMSVLDGPVRILRAYGLMRHPNALGAILPLSLLAAVSLSQRAGRPQRYAWLALTALNTAGLVLAFSRAGWLAALVGVIVLYFAGRRWGGSLNRSTWLARARRLFAASPLWLAALVIVAVIGLQPGLFLGRLLGVMGAGPSLEHGALAERLFSLQSAWSLIQRWPLWGVGTRQYVLAVAQLLHVAPSEGLLVESTPLVLWAELGLAAPLAWLGLGLVLVWRGCRPIARQAANPDLALSTAWIAAIQVVCLFQAFFWPGQELWQGGIWLGLALGLWARGWTWPAAPGEVAPPVRAG